MDDRHVTFLENIAEAKRSFQMYTTHSTPPALCRGDDRILAWDVMNEPWVTEIFLGDYNDPLPGDFARHFCDRILDKRCGVPITVGAGTLDRALRLADCVDIIPFHCYEPVDQLRDELERAYRVAASYAKPVLLTECLANSALEDVESVTDEGQLRVYERDLPVLAQARIGWFQFCLMVGRAPFSYTGIFYPNGVRRPGGKLVVEAAISTPLNRKRKRA